MNLLIFKQFLFYFIVLPITEHLLCQDNISLNAELIHWRQVLLVLLKHDEQAFQCTTCNLSHFTVAPMTEHLLRGDNLGLSAEWSVKDR